MFPGMNMNPAMMKQAMKKMGVQQDELDAVEVVIKTKDKELVFPNPSVAKIKMMGQESFQITGEFHERARGSGELQISDDDVKTVAQQANVSETKAKEALKKANGDIAAAIMALQEKE